MNIKITDIIRNLHTFSLNDLILLSQAIDDTITELADEMAADFAEWAGAIICD